MVVLWSKFQYGGYNPRNSKSVMFLFQHTDLSQYLEKHPGGLNTFNVKVSTFTQYEPGSEVMKLFSSPF